MAIHCTHCGAPLPLSSDGVPGGCTFCGAGKARVLDPVALAHTLERDAGDVQKFVTTLVSTLETAFPSRTTVERSGLFTKRVSGLKVDLEGYVFSLDVDDDKVSCSRARVVRGVTVKNESLSLTRWINELARALAAEAEQNAEAREALGKLFLRRERGRARKGRGGAGRLAPPGP